MANVCSAAGLSCFFFFNDTATTEIYTLSLHDALPIYAGRRVLLGRRDPPGTTARPAGRPGSVARDRPDRHGARPARSRSEEHTSELQSQSNLVCRLLLEKKKHTHYRRSFARMLVCRGRRTV